MMDCGEQSTAMNFLVQSENLEYEEQSDPMIHNKEFCSTSSIFSYLKNYNYNNHEAESQLLSSTSSNTVNTVPNWPTISNLELCKLMKNSGFAVGDLQNQQRAIYQHILARLGIPESNVNLVVSTDLSKEIEKFTANISKQYKKSSRVYDRLLKTFDITLKQDFTLPMSVTAQSS